MAEEIKDSTIDTEASKPDSIAISGTTWSCSKCGLVNDVSKWQCFACYAPMFDRKRQRNKNKNKKKNKKKNNKLKPVSKKQEIINKRQEKRAAVAKKETSDDNDNESKEEKPLYHVADNIPKTMTALVKEKGGKGYILKNDFPVPMPKEDELLIRSFSVAICGSDLVLYNWDKAAQSIAKLPFIPGHEAAGLVVGGGKDTNYFHIGDRVCIENHFFCGDCYQCNMKRRDICSNMNQFGHGKGTIYGGCCEYYTVKEKYCFRLRSNISWRDAALLEPLGVAHNACTQADLKPNESTLIIGCGTIGCMAVAVAKSMGVKNIIACDIVPKKLEIAKTMGATTVFDASKVGNLEEYIYKITDGVGAGRIIECSGDTPTINRVFKCVRKGGQIVLVGLPKETLKFENGISDVIQKSITLRTIHGRRVFDSWIAVEKLVKSKTINLDPLVSHNIPLKDFEDGYSALQSGKASKVVFDLTK